MICLTGGFNHVYGDLYIYLIKWQIFWMQLLLSLHWIQAGKSGTKQKQCRFQEKSNEIKWSKTSKPVFYFLSRVVWDKSWVFLESQSMWQDAKIKQWHHGIILPVEAQRASCGPLVQKTSNEVCGEGAFALISDHHCEKHSPMNPVISLTISLTTRNELGLSYMDRIAGCILF